MIYTKQEIDILREAGFILSDILENVATIAKIPGTSAYDLEILAETLIKEYKIEPAFKGYRGYPNCLCVSINEEIIHGLPKKDKIIKKGDIVSLDLGIVYKGYYSDKAITFIIGERSRKIKKLVKATLESLFMGLLEIYPGNYLSNVSNAIQTHLENNGLSVIKTFAGHGIGKELHEFPLVPNYGNKDEGLILKEGMVFTLEPMATLGKSDIEILDDGWTVVTKDKKLSAHFEHTIVVTKEEGEILTI